ncbi:hypothetical protein PHISCL_05289 [Aspergillus sclerotialis]|uniref:Uncharacterized protein n=1 Tax=Aspergillus sclerotialis TaxID=2070753 RepID=A0A3A2ZH93_9EURO|nr:hypothetical protein PHISCL_05289 [Aspergillus sclerotialis]
MPEPVTLTETDPSALPSDLKTATGQIHSTGPNAETASFTINGRTHIFDLHFNRPIPRFDISNATLKYRSEDDLKGRNIAFNGSVINPEDEPWQKDKFEANLANGSVLEGKLDKAWNQARTVYGVGNWSENVSDVGDVEMHESESEWGV